MRSFVCGYDADDVRCRERSDSDTSPSRKNSLSAGKAARTSVGTLASALKMTPAFQPPEGAVRRMALRLH